MNSPSEDTLVCNSKEHSNRACEDESFFGEYEGKAYCVLHFPSADKEEAFEAAVQRKVTAGDFNFQGAWFPSGYWFSNLEIQQAVDFKEAVFSGRASFHQTTFNSDVDFQGATFNAEAGFDRVTFKKKANFDYASFQKDANFHNVKFEMYASFYRCTFTGKADFHYAEFRGTASFWPSTFNSAASFYGASFARANFSGSRFKDKAIFNSCVFGYAEFLGVAFRNDTDFFNARFDGMANFNSADFETAANFSISTFNDEARFTSTAFHGPVDFSYTSFKDFLSFSAEYGIGGFRKNATCDFRHARFEAPHRVSFHSVTLRAYWFVNTDPQDFELIDVKWVGNLSRASIDSEMSELTKREELEDKKAAERIAKRRRDAESCRDEFEIENLKRELLAWEQTDDLNRRTSRFYRLLSITCRQFAVNAEVNHRYDEASDFRFWSMELRRKEGWKARGRLSIRILHVLYRYLSGYGEDVGRAFMVLIVVWMLFAGLYTRVGFVPPALSEIEKVLHASDVVNKPQGATRALAYSLAVITLQRPEPRPSTLAAWFAVLAETILGPIQAALLLLAVRRRFMR